MDMSARLSTIIEQVGLAFVTCTHCILMYACRYVCALSFVIHVLTQRRQENDADFRAVFVAGHSRDGLWPTSAKEAKNVHLFGEAVSELIGVQVPASMQLVRVLVVTGTAKKWECTQVTDAAHMCIVKLDLARSIGLGDHNEFGSVSGEREYVYTQTPVSKIITTASTLAPSLRLVATVTGGSNFVSVSN
jgi:hypothetical protein